MVSPWDSSTRLTLVDQRLSNLSCITKPGDCLIFYFWMKNGLGRSFRPRETERAFLALNESSSSAPRHEAASLPENN